jgi:transposase
MRLATVLATLLGLKDIRVLGVSFDAFGLVVEVKPRSRVPRCSHCGCKASRVHDRRRGRIWRHLDVAGMMVHLRYDIRRVKCPGCGVRVEGVPWAAPKVWFTYAFEDQVAYLAQRTDKTSVVEQMRTPWTTVGTIIERVVRRKKTGDDLDNLTIIGVDELSYRRHHNYVTVVIDHETGRVVWAKEGKNADTLMAFFHELGPNRAARLEAVTVDMSQAYIKAVTEASPQAQLIFDRFHVQRLAHDAVDEVRREAVREAQTTEEKKAVKKTRWALLKNPWNLLSFERLKLAAIQATNKRLYRAYLLKESLLDIFDRGGDDAEAVMDGWLAWAFRSRLKPFVKLARTIRDHKKGILAYVHSRLSNGRAEGLNGKIRTITRRSFGFHSAEALISLIKLCCSGIRLQPSTTIPRTHPWHPLNIEETRKSSWPLVSHGSAPEHELIDARPTQRRRSRSSYAA